MNPAAEFEPNPSKEILLAVVFWFITAAVITYLINRRRKTAGLAKATLFLAVWGLITVIPLLLAIPTGHLTLRQIRRSGGELKGKAQACFGLVCGYAMVLLLVGMLGFGVGLLARMHGNTVAEQANIQAIERAKAAWAATNSKKVGDVPMASELVRFMPGGRFPPTNIEGERYKINPVGVKVSIVPQPYKP